MIQNSFKTRRNFNWVSIGILYATFYMCRYNFRFAVPGLQSEFGYTLKDISFIFAIWSTAYGCGQFINGLITDKIGGKKSLIIGAVGTILINLIFGFSSLTSQFFTISLLAGLNGYIQSFGAPGLIKINSAWFSKEERGLFSGLFGGVIQLGQISISQMAPILLNSGLIIASIIIFSAGDWKSVFILPPIATFIALIIFLFLVKNTPEEFGFVTSNTSEPSVAKSSMFENLKFISKHPYIWYYAVAYACTGGVRHSLDQIAILYFRDQLGFDMKSNIPFLASLTLVLMPAFAFLGSLISGYLSDKYYKGERGPLAAILYFTESITILGISMILYFGFIEKNFTGILIGCFVLVLISFSVNSTHSLVGAAAPMDIGGRNRSGAATGIIDSFQYLGGGFSLLITGYVLNLTVDKYGYFFWYLIMSSFGVIAGVSMILMNRKKVRLEKGV